MGFPRVFCISRQVGLLIYMPGGCAWLFMFLGKGLAGVSRAGFDGFGSTWEEWARGPLGVRPRRGGRPGHPSEARARTEWDEAGCHPPSHSVRSKGPERSVGWTAQRSRDAGCAGHGRGSGRVIPPYALFGFSG